MITMGSAFQGVNALSAAAIAAAEQRRADLSPAEIRQPSLVSIRQAAEMNMSPPGSASLVKSTGGVAAVPKKKTAPAAAASSNTPLIIGGVLLVGVAAFVIMRRKKQ